MPIQSRHLPYPTSEEDLIRLTKDRRYWDERHPEFSTYQRIVREGYQRLFPGPLRYDARGAIVEAPPPKSGDKPPFIFAPEDPPRGNGSDGLLSLAAGRSGDTVHVHAYTRTQNGETVQVAEHDRAAPQGSGISRGPSKTGGSLPKKPNDDDLPPMISPIPGGHMRGDDGPPYGSGAFGATRTRPDGTTYEHQGADVAAKSGQAVVSPVTGTIERIGDPYDREKNPKQSGIYQSVTIRTADGYQVKLFYVALDPSIKKGTPVSMGQRIGSAQNLSKIYPPKNGGRMTNHIHVEVWKDGRYRDPTSVLSPKP